MKRSRVFWLMIIFSLLLSGCSSVKMIKSNMDHMSFSMKYEMDQAPPVTKKKNVTVSVAPVKFDTTMMNNTTVIKRDKALFFPLVFINVWERHDTCIQGLNSYEDDIPTFMQSTLVREINHSGLVNAEADNHSDYSLEVSIDNMKAEGPYKRYGTIFLLFVTRYEVAGPAVSNLKVTYALKKGNQVVTKNTFSSSKTTQWTKRDYVSKALMQLDYSASMVKASAYNFKQINKQIVNELNDYFSRVN